MTDPWSPDTRPWPDMPADVRGQLTALVETVTTVLGDNLIGAYLHGSLAMGCYCPGQSDADLLIATELTLEPAARRDLVRALLQLSGDPAPLEMSILRRADLTPWQYPTPFDLHYSEEWRDQMACDVADDGWRRWGPPPNGDPDLAAHITVLHARGHCLHGASIDAVFPVVPRAHYVASLADDAEWALERAAENPAYAVLNACRTLAYLREGRVLCKAEGGAWALQHLRLGERPLVEAAMAAYTGDAVETDRFATATVLAWLARMHKRLVAEGLPASAAT